MSKLSDVLHKVFGFVKAEVPDVEAEAKAILAKAEKDVADLQAKAKAAIDVANKSKSAADLRVALAAVQNAVSAHISTLEKGA